MLRLQSLIGEIHEKKGDLNRALIFYHRRLEIEEECLPPDQLLKKSVDKWSECRTLSEYQQYANKYECNDDWRKPIFLVLAHELPQLIDDLYFRHAKALRTSSRNVWCRVDARDRDANTTRPNLLSG